MTPINIASEQVFCLFLLKESFGMQLKQAEDLFYELVERYNEPHRRYHNLRHIFSVLECVKSYQDRILDYPILYLSVWFHDVIYDIRSHDNEDQSADYAKQKLESTSCEKDRIDQCQKLILSTKKHELLVNNFDNMILLDADLSILGASRQQYLEYSSNIRKEYSIIEDKAYQEGRTKVLNSLLNKERLYLTDEMFKTYELAARENIAYELKLLAV